MDILDRAAKLWVAANDDLLLIGGLAMRAHLGPLARSTVDVDCVAMTPHAESVAVAALMADGWEVGNAGPHRRARLAGERTVIDIFAHPITHPRTYETMTLRAAPVEFPHSGKSIFVAAPDDLAFLKLCAARDQDLVDVLLLCAHVEIEARALEESAVHDDLEIRLAEGALKARTLLERGEFARIIVELLGRPADDAELDAFARLLAALGKAGY